MTIPVQDAVTSSVANGVTTVFPFGFKILSESDLVVLLDDVEATSGFAVSGVGSDSGGNVTFTVPPANGVKVTRALQPELKRDVDYQQFGDWLSPEVNNDFDRIWLALQMLNHNDKRSLRISVDNTIDQTILETPAERAGKIIGFDASGNVILFAGADIPPGLVSALISNFLATTTQLDARNVIGAGDMDIADAQAETGVSFTTAGSAGTLTVSTSPAYGTLATGQRMRLKFNVASTGTDTLNRDTTGAKSLKQYDSTGTKVAAVFAANQLADVVYDGTDYVVLDPLPSASKQLQSITATVAANALTLGLNPTSLDFRSSALTNGVPNTRTVGAAISLVVPSSATLGTTNGVSARLALLAIDNAGTVELAVVNTAGGLNLDETTLISTTAISVAATSANVIYSTAARASVPFRVVGFIDITEATAGTWATAPTEIQGGGGLSLSRISPVVYTPAVTPIPASGTNLTASHSFGTVPVDASLELTCLTAEQGYSVGDVVQVNTNWTGSVYSTKSLWKSSTQVGWPVQSGTDICLPNKTTGADFTPTKANWSYRFKLRSM